MGINGINGIEGIDSGYLSMNYGVTGTGLGLGELGYNHPQHWRQDYRL